MIFLQIYYSVSVLHVFWMKRSTINTFFNWKFFSREVLFWNFEMVFKILLWIRPLSAMHITVVRCHWGPVIQSLARIGSPGPERFPYSFRMITRCFWARESHESTHHSAFHKPVELLWWTCGDKVIGYDWDSNPGSLAERPHLTTDLHILKQEKFSLDPSRCSFDQNCDLFGLQ
jgi:hypothetical protein